MTRRYIAGCDAVHPDRRGGQHVGRACTGVLVIDEESGLGVLIADERSQFKNKARADKLLDRLIEIAKRATSPTKREWLCTECDCEVRASRPPQHCPCCGAILVRYESKETT